MKNSKRFNLSLLAVCSIYGLAALLLFLKANVAKTYDPVQVVWDQQALLAWSLGFILCLAVLHLSHVSRRSKSHLTVLALAAFGLVATAIIFNGTPFSYNSYWGDQKFRQAMILKFVSFAIPGDFYYKHLPVFYPPLYYFLLSLYSRLFAVEYFKMLKIGNLLFFFFGPPLLYYFWSRITSYAKSALITLVTFLFAATIANIAYVAPHEILANMFFVPWWLMFIEGAGQKKNTRFFTLRGGIIGGLIFMTYYYAFFIGGVVLLVRHTILRKARSLNPPTGIRLSTQLAIMGIAAAVSAVYWLPLLLSMLFIGAQPTQNEWFNSGYAAMYFKFMEFSATGLFAAAGLFFVGRKLNNPVHRGLLVLVGGAILWVIIGAILGNLGAPVLYIKAYEFLGPVSAAMVGLWLATFLYAKGTRHRSLRNGYAFLVLILLMYCCNTWSRIVTSENVRTARTSWVRNWNTDAEEMNSRKGKVFLTGIELLPSFYPIYDFIATNEHYSHQASHYKDRVTFLSLLSYFQDPYLFYLGLRHNIYDPVDFYMPSINGGKECIRLALSGYPDRLEEYLVDFSRVEIHDSPLFMQRKGDHLYELADESSITPDRFVWKEPAEKERRITTRAAMEMMLSRLTPEGRKVVRSYVSLESPGWKELQLPSDADFGDSLEPMAAYAAPAGDSLNLVFAFRVLHSIKKSYQVMLHVADKKMAGKMLNYDFLPQPRTDTWKHGQVVICYRTIPIPTGRFSFTYGFFFGNSRMGSPVTVAVDGVGK